MFLSGKRLDARKDSDIFVYIHDVCILNQSNSPIESVSLGPGDPELLTLKGLHIFQGADKIDFLAIPPSSSTSAISLRAERCRHSGRQVHAFWSPDVQRLQNGIGGLR